MYCGAGVTTEIYYLNPLLKKQCKMLQEVHKGEIISQDKL